jgi:hypothetical protein
MSSVKLSIVQCLLQHSKFAEIENMLFYKIIERRDFFEYFSVVFSGENQFKIREQKTIILQN